MSETIFTVSLEIIAAILSASVFVADCLRHEMDAAKVRIAVRKPVR
ncbi:hypothetical protein [Methylocystis parvus]|nr:hypothetical protein [Methylocystis parvus]WBK00167.1 hypothetical protein MMG94_00100 [Methylocystis parvus OBBP]